MDMGKYFSDVVDHAVEDIYYCYDVNRAVSAVQSLMEAANSGDGDASYLLSRCLSGPNYSWDFHPFREDEEGANFFIVQSIRQGSAAGVLGAMRCGMLTPEMEEAMPFANLQEAWDVIYQKAQAGSLFCQNMIGNTYYWGDMVRIEGRGPDTFENIEDYRAYLREMTLASIPWFEKAFRGGMGFAGRNLRNLYQDGEEATGIPPQPEKAQEIVRLGAELGYPEWQYDLGYDLYYKNQYEEAVSWFRKSWEQGHLYACLYLGLAYREGEGVPQDIQKTIQLWTQGAAFPRDRNCSQMLGYLFFSGTYGAPVDYARGVQLMEQAVERGSFWQAAPLAVCYLTGKGCQKDYARAKWLLDNTPEERHIPEWYYGMGLMYAEGLGVPEDIKRGVEYLQESDYPDAKEALLRYKKNFFGKWVRR